LFRKIFLFFHNLRNAPDASVAMVDDERNTFYHHHGCVETQSLRLVNAYLADKGIDGHQQDFPVFSISGAEICIQSRFFSGKNIAFLLGVRYNKERLN
jgi:hypothetical protein